MTQPPYPDDPVLRALAEHWDSIMELADAEQQELIRGLVAGTVEPDPIEARVELQELLLDVLAQHAEHPVAEVLRTGTLLNTGRGAHDADLSLRRLRALVLPPEAGRAGPDGPSPGTTSPDAVPLSGAVPPGPAGRVADSWDVFDREVRTRLLALPAFIPGQLRGLGTDPDMAGLIRLAGQDQEIRLPAFQFTPTGRPWPVVLQVNDLLEAGRDPWGATCWWVDPHAGLLAAPADLLGSDRDDLLVEAASAVREED
jgi:hypothetical protein